MMLSLGVCKIGSSFTARRRRFAAEDRPDFIAGRDFSAWYSRTFVDPISSSTEGFLRKLWAPLIQCHTRGDRILGGSTNDRLGQATFGDSLLSIRVGSCSSGTDAPAAGSTVVPVLTRYRRSFIYKSRRSQVVKADTGLSLSGASPELAARPSDQLV
jgi:hypothetical protein